jgi:hypothetical protein
VIARFLAVLAPPALPTPTERELAREAARTLGHRAAALARQKARANRPALIAHLTKFGDAATRGLAILKESPASE